MAKLSQKNQKNNAESSSTDNNISNTTKNGVAKVKRTRRSVLRDSPPKRSSIYRGVTRQVILVNYLVANINLIMNFPGIYLDNYSHLTSMLIM